MRIADNVRAIKAALDRLTGSNLSGTRFSAMEPGTHPVNKGPGHDFDIGHDHCRVCKFTRIEMEDGFCDANKCSGPISMPTMVRKLKAGLEYWKHPDGSMWRRDMRDRPLDDYAEVAHENACFQAWLRDGMKAQTPEKPTKPTTAADIVNRALADSLRQTKWNSDAAVLLADRDACLSLPPSASGNVTVNGVDTGKKAGDIGTGQMFFIDTRPEHGPACPCSACAFERRAAELFNASPLGAYHAKGRDVTTMTTAGSDDSRFEAWKRYRDDPVLWAQEYGTSFTVPNAKQAAMIADACRADDARREKELSERLFSVPSDMPPGTYSNNLTSSSDLTEESLESALVQLKRMIRAPLAPHLGQPAPPTNCCGNPNCETCNDGRRRGVYVYNHA